MMSMTWTEAWRCTRTGGSAAPRCILCLVHPDSWYMHPRILILPVQPLLVAAGGLELSSSPSCLGATQSTLAASFPAQPAQVGAQACSDCAIAAQPCSGACMLAQPVQRF